MKILASVRYGKLQTLAAYDLLSGKANSFLVLNTDKDGNRIVLRLDNKRITDLNERIAEKNYTGEVDTKDAFVLKQC